MASRALQGGTARMGTLLAGEAAPMMLLLWVLGTASAFAGLLGLVTAAAWAWNARRSSVRSRMEVLKAGLADGLSVPATGAYQNSRPVQVEQSVVADGCELAMALQAAAINMSDLQQGAPLILDAFDAEEIELAGVGHGGAPDRTGEGRP